MLTSRLTAAFRSQVKAFSATSLLVGLLLLARHVATTTAAQPSSEEMADAFDCASALNDKVSRRDVSLNEDLASLSHEEAATVKEEQIAALEQDALLHQQRANQAEDQKVADAHRHRQLVDSMEVESNRVLNNLKHEIQKVEAEEQMAKEQLAEEQQMLQKVKDFNESVGSGSESAGETLEAAQLQSRVRSAGESDDSGALSAGIQGKTSHNRGGLASMQIDIQKGEATAEEGKKTLEDCVREKPSFLRVKKFARYISPKDRP